MWVARDKSDIWEESSLWLHTVKPVRNEKNSTWYSPNECCIAIDASLFPKLKWEDEPLEVELTISNSADSWRYYGGDDSFMGK